MALYSEFSPNGKFFAVLNKTDGNLKIWDSESNQLVQEYIPNLHLLVPCTCFTWISIIENNATKSSSDDNKKKIKKKSRKSLEDYTEAALYLAIGTNKGGVSLYSFATGTIQKYLKGNGHSGAVTAISKGMNSDLLTCGEDSNVVIWNVMSCSQKDVLKLGGNERPTCLMYLPISNRLVVGARNLKVWSLETMEVDQQYFGHMKNCRILIYFYIGSNEYLLSAPEMDRTVSLWSIKSGLKYKNAIGTFLMEDAAYFLNFTINKDGDLKIVAVTRSGVVHFYNVNVHTIKSAKPIKPKVTIEIASDSEPVEPIQIITASLEHGKSDNEILIGYGETQILRFENILPDFSDKRHVLIRNDPKKLVKTGTTATNKDALKTLKPIIDDHLVEFQSLTNVQRRTKSIEIPLETRLENVSLNIDGGNVPQGKNMVHLLMQGLNSHDINILRTVFSRTDEHIIRMTLQKLKPQYISPLLDELTIMTQKKTTHAQMAVVWLKILLQTHASQIMAFGLNGLYLKFGPILGILEHRANTLKPLNKLSGRLDLLISQIKRNTTEDEILDSENLLVFEDTDSIDEDDEMNDGGNSLSDDQSDDEDGNDSENNIDADEKMELSDDYN